MPRQPAKSRAAYKGWMKTKIGEIRAKLEEIRRELDMIEDELSHLP